MSTDKIAIIGLQVVVLGAKTPWAFLEQIRKGGSALSYFQAEDGWMGAKGLVEDASSFDADFFGVSKREARLMDPQQRLLLQTVWQGLEVAGLCPDEIEGPCALVASCSANSDRWAALKSAIGPMDFVASYQQLLGHDKDFLATKVAHKLNFKGPCYTVQTGCSSSLLAVHQAAGLLRLGEADVAIAGAISLSYPMEKGYPVVEGMIYSPTGRCSPYSSQADGTVDGTGCCVVVMKRLEDALKDGHQVWAVLEGSAVNNDGSCKVHYTAPSIDAHVRVMEKALERAGLAAKDVGYVEGHGTGTLIGDAMEIEALQEVYGSHLCALGSVKAQIGHLDVASGLVGLAKAVLCVKYGLLPGQESAFPLSSNFNSQLKPRETSEEWKSTRRVAAVSSLGIGGTNVHVLVGQYEQQETTPLPATHTFILSSGSEEGLDQMKRELASCLDYLNEGQLGAVAYTLAKKRKSLAHQWVGRAASLKELKEKLSSDPGDAEASSLPMENKIVSLPGLVFVRNIFELEEARGNEDVDLPLSAVVDQVWVQILGVESSSDENFFAVGGSSLSAVEFISELNRRLGTHLTPVTLYDLPTKKRLIERLNQEREIGPEEALDVCYPEL